MSEHKLHRFSDWTVYCSNCNREFQDPVVNGRTRPFPSEADLPKLKDNSQCLVPAYTSEQAGTKNDKGGV